MFTEVTPVSHISIKTDRITENSVGKRSHAGLTLLNVINSSTKGSWKSFPMSYLHKREACLSRDGRPDESCSSFGTYVF